MKFKWRHFNKQIILTCIRWYLAYPLSYRQIEEIMIERGFTIDHSTINRWLNKYSPLLEAKVRKHRKPVGTSWRLDETYIKVKASGNTCTVRSTNLGTQLIFSSLPGDMKEQLEDF